MNHNRIANNCVKYLNLVLGILMLVLFCLNLESILHSKTHELADFEADKETYWNHLGVLQDEKISRLFIQKCDECHQNALDTIIGFNVKGATLSIFLAALSFLFAFKLDTFQRHYIIFVPLTLITALITIIYFIYIFMHKNLMPEPCSDAGLEKKCNADIVYHMEYKILPYSFLMLVLVPQFISRSAELLFVKLCCHKKTFEYQTKYSRKKIYSIDSEIDNLELEDSGFRELPVDCPSTIVDLTENKTDKIIKSIYVDLNNNENKGFSEYVNDNYKFAESYEDDQIRTDILQNSQLSINFPDRKTIRKSTSLSTIAEEKTMNTDSMSKSIDKTNCPQLVSDLNGRLVIQKLLDEFHTKNTFINEVMHIFEPSSKMGNFNRNVPIRFSSPLKYTKEKLSSSQASLSLTSLCTGSTDPQSPKSNFSPASQKSEKVCNDALLKTLIHGSVEDPFSNPTKHSNWLGNLIVAKKIRLVKRLKNRIETKSGRRLFNDTKTLNLSNLNHLDLKCRNSIQINEYSKSNSPYRKNSNFKSRRNLSFKMSQESSSSIFTAADKMTKDIEKPSPVPSLDHNANETTCDYLPKLQLSVSQLDGNNQDEYCAGKNLQVSIISNRSLCINPEVEPVYF